MAWDTEAHRRITLAKLKFAPPDSVYAALRDYSDHVGGPFFFSADEELENTLLARNDPLINLGLARYAANETVLGALYRRGLEGTGDPDYDKGLRLGCLSNRALSRLLTGTKSLFATATGSGELRRIAHEGDDDEIAVLMRNPVAGPVLEAVYGQKPPFDSLDSNRLCMIVAASVTNPRINIDESDEHGPDLEAYGIHKEIYNLLRTAPVEQRWLWTLHELLSRIDPQAVHTPDADPQDALSRWSGLRLERGFGDDKEEEEGRFTSLTLVQEFRCLVAALYGRRMDRERGFVGIGGPDDPDVALRCAHYGNAALTREAMRAGYARDKEAFTLAALSNTQLFDKRELRAALEDMISRDLRRVYVDRCEQIHRRWPNFDPRPVSESGQDVLDDVIESRPSEEMTALARIASQVAELQRGLGRVHRVAVWGLVAVFAAIIYFNR